MDSNDRDRILETVRKLAAMANPENGAFPQEIATASAKMASLMEQYTISMSEVLFAKENSNGNKKEFDSASSKGMLGALKRWHWQLARDIARITGTKHYATTGYGATLRDKKANSRGHHMSFFGLNQSCQLAADLFDEWVVLIDDMGKKATSDYVRELTITYRREMQFQDVQQVRHLSNLGDEHPNVWRNSWLEGVASGIMTSLLEQEKKDHPRYEHSSHTEAGKRERAEHPEYATQAPSTALAVVNAAVEVAYKDFSSNFRHMGGSSSSGRNNGAFSSGHAVGKTLKIGSKRIS